ncbi:hypothetical protein DEO72_LG2g2677 [Vigna unguiculata]|uniref:Uncharacterized protein n=1 Tax=Vigna unguiculata TaxID=3917 RepID=A0A4D6L1G3_VIGUN|nr:hypothetical protein DEO72_LG2g2677 [Vigna unguiculata]
MNPDVLKNAKEGLKKVEKIETPQLTRTLAQRYKDLEARLDEMNRSGEGSGSDLQKSEAPVPSSEGQKPPCQSINAIKRGKSLYFRLGQSHHSCNSPVHRSREHPNRCRVPLFPVRESPSALTGRARILMSDVSLTTWRFFGALILDDLEIERQLRQDYLRSDEKKECIPIDSKGERRTEWRMEAYRLECGLAGREEANNKKNQSGCRCSGRNGSLSNRNWSTSRKTWKKVANTNMPINYYGGHHRYGMHCGMFYGG